MTSVTAFSRTLALFLFFGACTKEIEPLPDWSEGYPSADTDTDTDTDADTDTDTDVYPFRVTIPDGALPFEYRFAQAASPTTACELLPGTVGDAANLTCVFDAEELDLWALGFAFAIYSPPGMCDYVAWRHYSYETFEVGVGPAVVRYAVDIDGNITDIANSVNGQPYCEYDYTDAYYPADGPNCCLGKYTEIAELPDGVVVNSGLEWGGTASDCYGGAAFVDPEAIFNEAGFPIGHIVYLNEEAYYHEFDFPSPMESMKHSNLQLVNYYRPEDHNGGLPEGPAAEYAHPWYTYECLDHADEVIARIRVVVREWNEREEYLQAGDPETTGLEEYWGEPIDDIDDWASGTPGTGTWIEIWE